MKNKTARIMVMLLTALGMAGASAGQTDNPKLTKIAGTVRFYEAGKKIAIDIQPKVERTYNLADEKCVYHVDPDVAVGTKVLVEESHGDSGGKVVTIHITQ